MGLVATLCVNLHTVPGFINGSLLALEASLLGALVSLLCDLGEYEKAAEPLERAHALYRRLGDFRLEGVSVSRPPEDETGEVKDQQDQQIG